MLLKELQNNWCSIEASNVVARHLVISIGRRAGPIMSDYSVVNVLNQSKVDSRPVFVGYSIGRDWRGNIVEAQAVSCSPLLDEMRD